MPNSTMKSKRGGQAGSNRNHMIQLRQQTAAIRDDIKELASTAGHAAVAQVHPVEEYVRKQPLKSMLIAAGIGAALGFLFRGR